MILKTEPNLDPWRNFNLSINKINYFIDWPEIIFISVHKFFLVILSLQVENRMY